MSEIIIRGNIRDQYGTYVKNGYRGSLRLLPQALKGLRAIPFQWAAGISLYTH